MKKVSALLLFATLMLTVGVTFDASAKEIAKVEVSKIEKSYSANVETKTNEDVLVINSLGVYQDDIYYSEQTAYGNYTLPKFEDVYIEVTETPPNKAEYSFS